VLLRLARDAKALRTAMVAVGLYIASLAARNFDLQITAWVLEASAIIGGSVLILAFHGELRYAITRFNSLFRLWPARPLPRMLEIERSSTPCSRWPKREPVR